MEADPADLSGTDRLPAAHRLRLRCGCLASDTSSRMRMVVLHRRSRRPGHVRREELLAGQSLLDPALDRRREGYPIADPPTMRVVVGHSSSISDHRLQERLLVGDLHLRLAHYSTSDPLARLAAGPPLYLTCCFVATVPFAVASWWLVEKRSLRLKNLLPRTQSRAAPIKV